MLTEVYIKTPHVKDKVVKVEDKRAVMLHSRQDSNLYNILMLRQAVRFLK